MNWSGCPDSDPSPLLPKAISRTDCHGLNMADLGSIVGQCPLVSVADDDDCYSLGYPARGEPRAALTTSLEDRWAIC